MKKEIFIINAFLILFMFFSNININATTESYYDNDSFENENIRDYDVEIHLNEDASMEVTEKIKVNVTGNYIKQCIYRDFSTQDNKEIKLDIKEILFDEENVLYSLKRINTGFRIQLGSKNKIISKGIHTYQISYKVEREIEFEKNYDKLYWDTIGTGWDYSIDHCHVRVYLPDSSKVIENKLKTYTGKYGTKKNTKNVYINSFENYIDFEVNGRLDKKETFAILVCLEKGTLIEPTLIQKIKWFASDNIISSIVIILLAFLILWQFLIWLKHGKDPIPNVIVPRYYPPEGMAPCDVKYISTMGKMDKILEATIISLAIKGYMKFDTKRGKIMLIKTSEITNLEKLNDVERDVYNTLPLEQVVEYSLFFQTTLKTLKNVIENKLKSKYENKLFFHNTKLISKSIAFTIISFIIAIFIGAFSNIFVAWQYCKSLALIIPVSLIISVIIIAISNIKKAKTSLLFRFTTFLISVVPIIVFLIAMIFAVKVSISVAVISICCFVAATIDNFAFIKLIKKYSEEGLRAKEEIEGFKMFINTASDVDFKNKTPEMFDKYFPYAYVLGLENNWAEKFEDILKIADYSPSWCSSNLLNEGTFDAVIFTNTFSSRFSSAISDALVTPKK